MSTVSRSRASGPRAYGFSMIEAVISTAIIGGLLAAALSAAGAASRTRSDIIERSAAQGVLREFWVEISRKSHDQIINPALPMRLGFNDIFDYEKYHQSPPTRADGSALPGADRLSVRVAVRSLHPTTLLPDDPGTGLAEVVISVRRGDRIVAELPFLHSRTWSEVQR
jgi:type II secretory pathway pseudopilin PulG